ncbi:hypothetical protein RRG08_009462 [Elysia crispata]|uniref:Uncharacterized protein n=1 Tax=Elysia crispata TaxID=231223 RepID=A0AAE1ASL0_9GAST|nr:hypothetical protein RRG08_009462 [Elysia crispata]
MKAQPRQERDVDGEACTCNASVYGASGGALDSHLPPGWLTEPHRHGHLSLSVGVRISDAARVTRPCSVYALPARRGDHPDLTLSHSQTPAMLEFKVQGQREPCTGATRFCVPVAITLAYVASLGMTSCEQHPDPSVEWNISTESILSLKTLLA